MENKWRQRPALQWGLNCAQSSAAVSPYVQADVGTYSQEEEDQEEEAKRRRPISAPAGIDDRSSEPVDPLHRSDVTREQSRLNAASATPTVKQESTQLSHLTSLLIYKSK